jgi:hypothetical protein
MQITAKKKILVFIDWYLPGYKAGGSVRSMANMTGHLSGEFDFYIVTRNNEYGETAPYINTVPDSWNHLMPGVKVWYASEGQTSLSVWKHLIKTSHCDVVYINGVYSPKFSLLPLIAAKFVGFKSVIVAPRGILAGSAINVRKGKKQLFLKAAQWLRLYMNVQWHGINQAEPGQVRQHFDEQAYANQFYTPLLSKCVVVLPCFKYLRDLFSFIEIYECKRFLLLPLRLFGQRYLLIY